MKAKIIILGVTLLIWSLVFLLHAYYHIKRNISLGGYGYEVDPGFLFFVFIMSWGIFYLLALVFIVVVELCLLNYWKK
jgi:hypothetical protein